MESRLEITRYGEGGGYLKSMWCFYEVMKKKLKLDKAGDCIMLLIH